MSVPSLPLYVVGHSYAGHAFGVLPDPGKVAGFCVFGTGAGWHGWMSWRERIKVLMLWHIAGPLLALPKGYLPLSALGIGEDLPLDFYRQWKHWCRFPNYCFGDPAMQHLARDFERVRAPLLAVNATDDAWSPPRSRDALISAYRNAGRRTVDVDPSQIGLRNIGHMGYFKPDAMPLWEFALEWLGSIEYPACRSHAAAS